MSPPLSSTVPASADVSSEPRSASWVCRLMRWLVVALLFYPALRAVQDVREYVTNVPHYDDFTFEEDLIKFREGKLTVSDLFSVHLEHRVTVPRLMALASHLIGRSDLRWQNAYTLLLLLGMYWNLLVIWKRTAGASLAESWLPLLLMSSLLFCAVQWALLLWPMLFEIAVPIFCYTTVLRLWSSRMNPALALALSAMLCVLAMLSFGNGPLAWLLLPFSIWFQRPDLSTRTRGKLLGAWLLLVTAALVFQFHDYHNSAPKQFAYNYDDKMTALDTVTKSLPLSDPSFILKALGVAFAVLGGHLSRGLHLPNIATAQCVGGVSAFLLIAAAFWLWRNLRDREFVSNTTPWVLLGLFSLGTALLISAGRTGLTKSGSIALEPRYASHAVPLTLAVTALVWIVGHRLLPKWPALRGIGFAVGGALLMLVAVEWVYGERHMELWMNSRLQCKALMMFTELVPDKQFLGQVSGDGAYGARVITALEKHGDAPFKLLTNTRLDQFHIKKPIKHRQAGFEELHEAEGGGLVALGYAEMPNRRPADLILFTTPDTSGAEQIFGLSYLVRMDGYEAYCTYKDDKDLSFIRMTPELATRWEGHVTLITKPARDAPIKAWAFDADRMCVYAVPDDRATTEILPPLPKKPTDDDRP